MVELQQGNREPWAKAGVERLNGESIAFVLDMGLR